MATVPTGYVFWDASAKKSYDAGKTMPVLGNGDYLVPATSNYDGYYQQYIYYTSNNEYDVYFTNGWSGVVQSEYLSKPQKAPFNSIGGKPVRIFSYYGCTFTSSPTVSGVTNLWALCYWKCLNLTTVPTLPPNLKSVNYSFAETKINSPPNLSGLTNLQFAKYTFMKCFNLTSPPDISTNNKLTNMVGMFENCPNLVVPSGYTLPSGSIDIGFMFYNCPKVVNGVTIPATVTSAYAMYQKCTALEGFINILCSESANLSRLFSKTIKQIVLIGGDAACVKAARSAENGNAFVGVKANPLSLTAIRCDANGNELVTGQYCKLTCSFTAPNVQNAKILPPTIKRNGSALTLTWRLNSLTGTQITSSGIQLPTSGKIVTLYTLASGEEAVNFSLKTKTSYNTYTWDSGEILANLTYAAFLIDFLPNGTGMAIGKEAVMPGLEVDFDSRFNKLLNKDTELEGLLTGLGWTDCIE